MPTIQLTPPSRPSAPYPIVVEQGSVRRVPAIVQSTGAFDSIIILCDEAVEGLAGELALGFDHATVITIPSGESSKSLAQVQRVCERMLEAGATRQSLLINVGGGMLTDLGGFVASVFMRGIAFLNVPTTLLGMVDASIGGKTGIDLHTHKNILGRIEHPQGVIIDIDTLESLPDEQLKEGLVEVVKIAAMLNADFFAWLEENLPNVMLRNTEAMTTCIAQAVELKAKVVEQDENDANIRLFLNFGHTVGHALETLSEFTISHGKAVSMGMARELMMANTNERERVIDLLHALGMPVENDAYDPDELWLSMQSDKKKLRGEVRIAVPQSIGKPIIRTISKYDVLRSQ